MGTKRNSSDSNPDMEDSKRQNTQSSPGSTAKQGSGESSENAALAQHGNLAHAVQRSDLDAVAGELRSEIQGKVDNISTKLENLYLSHSAMVGSVNFHGDFLDSINTRLQDAVKRDKLKDKQIEDLTFELQETQATLRQVNKKATDTQMELKSKNLVINGIAEKPDENCKTSVTTFLRNIIPNFSADSIENAYRLGKPAKKLVRGMLVKFKNLESKQSVMVKKSALKDRKDLNKVYCNDDLTDENRKVRQKIRLIAKFANSQGYKDVKAKGNKLILKGRSFNEKELTLLPSGLRIENVVTRNVGLGIGFYGEYSYLLNQFPSRLRMNGLRFLCAEQAFYYFKGIICQYEDTSLEIKKMIDPNEMKILGERIPTCTEWERKKERLMKSVLRHKFDQNPVLKEKLINTGKMSLLECTTDSYWSTGLILDSPNWNKSYNYKGLNRLGFLLEEVRNQYPPADNAGNSPILETSGENVGTNSTSRVSENTLVPSTNPPANTTPCQGPAATSHHPSVSGNGNEVNLDAGKIISTSHDKDSNKKEVNEIVDTESEDVSETSVPTGTYTDSQLMEIDKISFHTSSLNASQDSQSSTGKDDSLFRSSENKWDIPALNTSKLLNRSGFGGKDQRDNLRKLLQSQPGGDSFRTIRTSTPVVTVMKKKISPLKSQHDTKQKVALDLLLDEA